MSSTARAPAGLEELQPSQAKVDWLESNLSPLVVHESSVLYLTQYAVLRTSSTTKTGTCERLQ